LTPDNSVEDSGCFRIPDPGSDFFPSRIRIFPTRIRIFSIPDPNFIHPESGSRIHIKEFKYFNPKKWFLSSRKYDRVVHSGSRIRILTFYPSRIPDPGVKKAPDPGSATLPETGIRDGKNPDPGSGSGMNIHDLIFENL
jgi:hypothetical protein